MELLHQYSLSFEISFSTSTGFLYINFLSTFTLSTSNWELKDIFFCSPHFYCKRSLVSFFWLKIIISNVMGLIEMNFSSFSYSVPQTFEISPFAVTFLNRKLWNILCFNRSWMTTWFCPFSFVRLIFCIKKW